MNHPTIQKNKEDSYSSKLYRKPHGRYHAIKSRDRRNRNSAFHTRNIAFIRTDLVSKLRLGHTRLFAGIKQYLGIVFFPCLILGILSAFSAGSTKNLVELLAYIICLHFCLHNILLSNVSLYLFQFSGSFVSSF